MIKHIMSFILAFAFYGGLGADTPTTIKVLIAEGIEETRVSVEGGYQLVDPKNNKTFSTTVISKDSPLKPQQRGLFWGEEYPGRYRASLTSLGNVFSLRVDGQEYDGILHICQVEGKLSIVNEVNIEDYLRSVLSHEFSAAPSFEVMAAITIAARTHAYFDAQRGKEAAWNVRKEDVGYVGKVQGHPSVIQAIDETHHVVMTLDDLPSQTFPAVWTEDSGGRTAPYHLIFRKGVPYPMGGVEAPLAARDRVIKEWQCSVSTAWLASFVGFEDITAVDLFADPFSKKVYSLRLRNGQESKEIDFFALQEEMGAGQLLSSDFTAEVEEGNVLFRGYGVGHGVGICLYSAKQMETSGKSAREILENFYPDAHLQFVKARKQKEPRGRGVARSYALRHRNLRS